MLGEKIGSHITQALKISIGHYFVTGITRQLFKEHKGFEALRNVLGSAKKDKVESAVLDQIWTGFDEYTEEFYRVIIAT